MSILEEIKSRFKNGSIVEQLIFVLIGTFIVTALTSSFSGLSGQRTTFFGEWFAVSPSFEVWFTRPWTIITYGFLHSGFLHILFNCIWLYFFGRLFLDFFTPKQLLTFFLLGTLFGGFAYMFSYNFFPLFENTPPIPMVGASAGVSAIVVGLATHVPNYQVKLRFIGYLKVWHIAAISILLDLIGLDGYNGGGHFSHLGGALFGFLYVSQAKGGKTSVFDLFSNLFKKKKKPLRTVHKSKKRPVSTPKNVKSDTQEKIDHILDKISKSGYDTLSKEEKEFLFKQRK